MRRSAILLDRNIHLQLFFKLYLYTVMNRIAMNSRTVYFLIVLISATLGSAAAKQDANITEFIKSSCNVTQYSKLCVSALSTYPGSFQPTQKEVTKAAVNLTLVFARNVSVWATGLKHTSAKMSEGERAALEDCIDNFEDARDEIHESLAKLKHLRKNTFNSQMADVQTWLSAALSNEDSCLDGFQDVQGGAVKPIVTIRVQIVSKLISIALALVNALAATGGGNDIPL